MNNFWKLEKIIAHACSMCLAVANTVDHLLLNFHAAEKLWRFIQGWLD